METLFGIVLAFFFTALILICVARLDNRAIFVFFFMGDAHTPECQALFFIG